MPIYEYRCQACGIELEKLQKLSDPLLVECPECGRETLVKLVSASSFRLKGGGWYETDFKTGKKKHGAGEADNAANAGGAGDSAGKPAATAGASGADKDKGGANSDKAATKEAAAGTAGSAAAKTKGTPAV